MRDIRFRAWDKENSEMKYNAEQAYKGHWQMNDIQYFGQLLNHPKYELMQYTGLKDNNGKPIYEGDIVKQVYHFESSDIFDGPTSFDGYHIGEVVIIASQGVCMKKPLCYAMETDETTKINQYKKVAGYRCEVIGNIYENTELLEEPK